MLDEQRQPVDDDDDLAKRSRSDNFWFIRGVKCVGFVIFLVLVGILTFELSQELLDKESATRKVIVDAVANNIIGILFGFLSLIGISIYKK